MYTKFDKQEIINICKIIGYKEPFILGNPESTEYIQYGESANGYSVYLDITDLIYQTDFIITFVNYIGISIDTFSKELLFAQNHIILLTEYLENKFKVIEKIFRYRTSDNLYYSYEVGTTGCIDLLYPFDNLDGIIEQYIGECDKNKEMIFENDIIDYYGRKIKVKIPDIYREEISFNDTLIIK